MTPTKDQTFVLAGDVGGTKTNLGFFLKGKGRPLLKVIETYSSREANNLESIIERFLERHPASITSACFGIAGPVVNGLCKTTNLPWDVSEVRLRDRFKWEHVRLLNDLTATALAVPLLDRRKFFTLNKARMQKGQERKPLGLVAPGTGLGQALLIFKNGRYIPISSEGGHADFSPNTEAEVRLWKYLYKRFGHVSIERVLSGSGLLNIYSWIKETGRHREPAWLNKKIKAMDPATAITESALEDKHPLCVESLNMFVSILGAVSGNLALIALTTGGVYLGGGIPPRILPKLREGLFMAAFVNKGRFKAFMGKIPVRVILDDKAALIGAAHCAASVCEEKSPHTQNNHGR
jgi:glucokinase